MTTIIHPYSENTDATRTSQTNKFFQDYNEFDVQHVLCKGKYDYYDALKSHWGTDDLIIVEHDIIPTAEDLDKLSTCREPWCGQLYFKTYGVIARTPIMDVTIYHEKIPVHRNVINSQGTISTWGRSDDDWADLLPNGCTKISLTLQEKFTIPRTSWEYLDSIIGESFHARNVRGHLHKPSVQHCEPTTMPPWPGANDFHIVAGYDGLMPPNYEEAVLPKSIIPPLEYARDFAIKQIWFRHAGREFQKQLRLVEHR